MPSRATDIYAPYRPPLFLDKSKVLLSRNFHEFEETQKIRISRCVEAYKADVDSHEKCTGPNRHKALEDMIRRLEVNWPRSPSQVKFHQEYIKGMLGKIYGADLLQNIGGLLERYGISELKSDVIITAPRRYGKTMSVAMMVTAFILSQPSRKVVIFSTGRRASQSMLELIKSMVDYLIEDKSRIITSNTERLVVMSIWGSKSEVVSLPNNVKISLFLSLSLFFFFSLLKKPRRKKGCFFSGTCHTHTHTRGTCLTFFFHWLACNSYEAFWELHK
jgi:hypothetical protein